jgi:hypothetical protein
MSKEISARKEWVAAQGYMATDALEPSGVNTHSIA